MEISPFSKPHYVSHTIGDHTSLLAFIEKRFLQTQDADGDRDRDGRHAAYQHLTSRDQAADSLEDLFDFDRAPSLQTALTQATPPTVDCTPVR
jgi:hypothetical protein